MNFWKKTPKSDRFLLSWAMVCLVASMMLLTVRHQAMGAKASEDEQFLRFVDTAAEIYNEIRGKYVDEVETQKVLESALSGMFLALDDHSQYMDPAMLDNLNKDTGGNFSGIGIHITERQGLLTVIAPIPGSPSAAIGIMPWDRIIEIDGESTEGVTLQEAVEKLTGPSGTQVTIKVYREGETQPLEFTITRASIKIDSVHYRLMEDGIGYLRIARFSENTASDMRKAIFAMKSEGMRGLVLDLRFNTGGLLREAIEVSNLFVPKHEVIVSTKGRLRSQNREYRASEDPIVTVPTFVLVNEGSASASEIVAGALQDHNLGVIIGPQGKNTFGKGSVQTIETLRHSMYDDESGNPKQSAMRLTTARYYTPSGRTINHIGVTPDIGISLPEFHERDLLRAGLYGDTTIPMSVEEKEAEEARRNREEKVESGSEGVVIQRIEELEENATEEEGAEGAEGAEGSPFYSSVRRPELAENEEFRDIMLDEAQKQMKIYMILARKDRGESVTHIAGASPSDAPATEEVK